LSVPPLAKSIVPLPIAPLASSSIPPLVALPLIVAPLTSPPEDTTTCLPVLIIPTDCRFEGA
jgi:hypothetical protein